MTHLNLNFFSHLVKVVVVAEKLEIGAKILVDRDEFMHAFVDPTLYSNYGEVDVTKRAEQMKRNIHTLTRSKGRSKNG